jgi:peptidoglycan-associated lipoprotein
MVAEKRLPRYSGDGRVRAKEAVMMKVLLVLTVIACIVLVSGCHPKKMQDLEESEAELRARQEREARERAEAEAQTREREIKPIQPEAEEKLELGEIHFAYDKYNLTEEATSVLSRNAEKLMNNPSAVVIIEGHCDERGTDEYNLAL